MANIQRLEDDLEDLKYGQRMFHLQVWATVAFMVLVVVGIVFGALFVGVNMVAPIVIFGTMVGGAGVIGCGLKSSEEKYGLNVQKLERQLQRERDAQFQRDFNELFK